MLRRGSLSKLHKLVHTAASELARLCDALGLAACPPVRQSAFLIYNCLPIVSCQCPLTFRGVLTVVNGSSRLSSKFSQHTEIVRVGWR